MCVQARDGFNAFLGRYHGGAIFDEVQNLPELLSYLQEVIDNDRHLMGRFIITGSQNFALSQSISQSLAGRIGMVTLLPLVDVVADWAGTQYAIEIKMNTTFNADYLKGLKHFAAFFPRPFVGMVVYAAAEQFVVGSGIILKA